MSFELSANTQAILLLTAPLLSAGAKSTLRPLRPGEYKRLARRLRRGGRQPSDLLGCDQRHFVEICGKDLDSERLGRLLGRGFLLSQAIEHWRSRAIWVVSRADVPYPKRLKKRLGENAPPVLYGCGDLALLAAGGLAVVGSRHVDDKLIEDTRAIGLLIARAGSAVVSGGARGVDQAAMRGALDGGGAATGVLANGLERAVMAREHRDVLMEGRLVLASPYDPIAGFHVGHAMQRNKLIYALADAALVMSSGYQHGGTWTGAVEQLESLKLVPVYVRANGKPGRGLQALRRKGALEWPDPRSSDALAQILSSSGTSAKGGQTAFSWQAPRDPSRSAPTEATGRRSGTATPMVSRSSSVPDPAETLFATVRNVLERIETPKTDAEIAEELQVQMGQVRAWLKRLVDEGALEKLARPVRYRSAPSPDPVQAGER